MDVTLNDGDPVKAARTNGHLHFNGTAETGRITSIQPSQDLFFQYQFYALFYFYWYIYCTFSKARVLFLFIFFLQLTPKNRFYGQWGGS